MRKVTMPDDIDKIYKAVDYFKGNISLCGSVADFFLLKQSYAEVKDMDFVIKSLKDIQYNIWDVKYSSTTFLGNFLHTRKINERSVEIFENKSFDIEKESIILTNGLRCVTPLHRYNFLKYLKTRPDKYLKDTNSLLKQYEKILRIF